MKKCLLSFVLAITILCVFSLPTYAAETISPTVQDADGATVIYYEDGSSFTITPVRVDESANLMRATAKTKSSSRDVYFTNAEGVMEWKYTLSATFSYVEGVSSTCTNASYTQTVYSGGWKFSDGAATKSGNVATGNGKYVKKILFITAKTYNIDIIISCDKYGNIT